MEARAAKEKYERAVRELEKKYNDELKTLRTKYSEELKKVREAALKKGDLDEAQRILAAEDELKTLLRTGRRAEQNEEVNLRAEIERLRTHNANLLKLARAIDISNVNEQWTKLWIVTQAADDKGKVGFHLNPVQLTNWATPLGRKGIVCVHPVSKGKPARIARYVRLNGRPVLSMDVSASPMPNTDFVLQVKVNGQTVQPKVTISEQQGWKAIRLPLFQFANQEVLIEIEVWGNDWSYDYAFFDYIRID